MITIVDVSLRVFLQRRYNLAVFGAVTEQELPALTQEGMSLDTHSPKEALARGL